MKRILIIASHEKMADGMKDTLNFISGGIQETVSYTHLTLPTNSLV